MSHTTDKLRQEHETAEALMFQLQAERDAAVKKARDEYRERIEQAIDAAAAAQKALCDAEAAQALVGRDDAETVAANLGLTLPED